MFITSEINKYRKKVINLEKKEVLLTNLSNTKQEKDITLPLNLAGIGRIHHFRRSVDNWIRNPLPMVPAEKYFGVSLPDEVEVQVFQVAMCNLHCWYCFVPDELNIGSELTSTWVKPSDLVKELTTNLKSPIILDLSGGNPELVPEWVSWTIEEVKKAGCSNIYIWSDDSLSCDYSFRNMKQEYFDALANTKFYGKVCCFKGFDNETVAFNSGRNNLTFSDQISLFSEWKKTGIDLYGYITLTTPNIHKIDTRIASFMDQMQSISSNLPLRIVPLKIFEYSAMVHRISKVHKEALNNQNLVLECWNEELQKRFSHTEIDKHISDIEI